MSTTDSPTPYDPNSFERPSVTVDVVAFTARERKLHVLLIKRGVWPFEGHWALPGGFVQMSEGLDAAAHRELAEETGIAGAEFLEQLYTFGNVDRDPRTRVISVAYYALLPEPSIAPRAGTDAAEAQWWPADALPPLAFDHAEIVKTALDRLRAKLGYTSVAYALLAPEFTLTELQTVYEIILGRELDKRNFRKKMLSTELLEGLEKQRRGGAHRPAQLFSFTKREPVFLD
ncbi:NUDIX domain-containing protein [Armatimonas sp.]|uniref:NUDIX hydrolase n=1 Tax=Armatimonas sp. TaxID=1872638 RepID=UPI00286BD00A|nr:NUDIX domain-containing protein [Armatimonas sp.]